MPVQESERHCEAKELVESLILNDFSQRLERPTPQGCYITVPTLFHDDDDLTVNAAGIREHVRFLLKGGISAENSTLLAGGAAGDFSTMTFDERLHVAEAVVDA